MRFQETSQIILNGLDQDLSDLETKVLPQFVHLKCLIPVQLIA